MEDLSKKDKKHAKDSEETKIPTKILMMLHLQNNVIRFTLTNIFSFEK